jgi:hypothetical protein
MERERDWFRKYQKRRGKELKIVPFKAAGIRPWISESRPRISESRPRPNAGGFDFFSFGPHSDIKVNFLLVF